MFQREKQSDLLWPWLYHTNEHLLRRTLVLYNIWPLLTTDS